MKLSRKIRISNPNGLHLRIAAQLVRLIQCYKSNIFVQKGLQMVNARSILCLLQLTAVFGAELTFILEGDDASQALDAIQRLLENKGS